MLSSSSPQRVRRSPVTLGLVVIVTVVSAFAIGIPILQETVRGKVESIAENALTSVQAIDRMRLDLHRGEILLQAHVHEKDAAAMAVLSGRVTSIEDDLVSAVRDYDALARLPEEDAPWGRFRQAAAEYLRKGLAVLSLSTSNRDVDAQAGLEALKGLLTEADESGEQLSRLNARAARAAEAEIGRTLLLTNAAFVGIALLIIALSLFVGARTLSAEVEADRTAHEMRLLGERNRELDAFAGRVAHDLRGPLQTLSLTSAALLRQAPREEGKAKVIARSVDRLSAMVDDLLALSRIGGATIAGSCDLAATLEEIRQELLPRLAAQGATLRVDAEPSHISYSPGLLRQAIWNVIDNGLKYGRTDVPVLVEVRGRQQDGEYELRVSDNGSGMSQEDARQIFKPFYRGAQALSGKPGTGLGLAIAQRVTETAGGSIAVVSEAGKGSTFVLRFPCERETSATRHEGSGTPAQPPAPH